MPWHKHMNFHPRQPGWFKTYAILVVCYLVVGLASFYLGWKLHDPLKAPDDPKATVAQMRDFMRNGMVRAAWRSVYCNPETEIILSSPIQPMDSDKE